MKAKVKKATTKKTVTRATTRKTTTTQVRPRTQTARRAAPRRAATPRTASPQTFSAPPLPTAPTGVAGGGNPPAPAGHAPAPIINPPAPVTYRITVGTAPTSGGSVQGSGTFNQGALVTLVATPAAGHTFRNWTENGTVINTATSYSFVANANRTLFANFAVVPPPAPAPAAAPAANPAPGAGTNPAPAANPAAAPVTAPAAAAAAAPAANPATVVVQNPPTVTYQVTTVCSPATGGSVTGGGTFNAGASATVNATPAAGHTFRDWTDGTTVLSSSASFTFPVNGDRTLTANFTPVAQAGPFARLKWRILIIAIAVAALFFIGFGLNKFFNRSTPAPVANIPADTNSVVAALEQKVAELTERISQQQNAQPATPTNRVSGNGNAIGKTKIEDNQGLIMQQSTINIMSNPNPQAVVQGLARDLVKTLTVPGGLPPECTDVMEVKLPLTPGMGREYQVPAITMSPGLYVRVIIPAGWSLKFNCWSAGTVIRTRDGQPYTSKVAYDPKKNNVQGEEFGFWLAPGTTYAKLEPTYFVD